MQQAFIFTHAEIHAKSRVYIWSQNQIQKKNPTFCYKLTTEKTDIFDKYNQKEKHKCRFKINKQN